MKYEIDLILIFSSKTNAKTFFDYLDAAKSNASPELYDAAPTLEGDFSGQYKVCITYRLDTKDQQSTILNYITTNQSKILKGIVKTHDCYHDEDLSCKNENIQIIGDCVGEII